MAEGLSMLLALFMLEGTQEEKRGCLGLFLGLGGVVAALLLLILMFSGGWAFFTIIGFFLLVKNLGKWFAAGGQDADWDEIRKKAARDKAAREQLNAMRFEIYGYQLSHGQLGRIKNRCRQYVADRLADTADNEPRFYISYDFRSNTLHAGGRDVICNLAEFSCPALTTAGGHSLSNELYKFLEGEFSNRPGLRIELLRGDAEFPSRIMIERPYLRSGREWL